MADSSPKRLLLVLFLCSASCSLSAAARELFSSSSSTSERKFLTTSEMDPALHSHSRDSSSPLSSSKNDPSLSDALGDAHAFLYSLSGSGSGRRLLLDAEAKRRGNLLLHPQQQQQQQQHSSPSTASSSSLPLASSSPSSRSTLEPSSESTPKLSLDMEAALLSSIRPSAHADLLAFGRAAAAAHSELTTEMAEDGGTSRVNTEVVPERAARGSEIKSMRPVTEMRAARDEETRAAPLQGSKPAARLVEEAVQVEAEAEAEAKVAEAEEDDDAKVDGGGAQQLLFSQELDEADQLLLRSAATLIASEEEEEDEFGRVRELHGEEGEYLSIVNEVMSIRQNLSPTLAALQDKTSKHVIPGLKSLARTTKAAIDHTSQRLDHTITPYFGTTLSPVLATTMAYTTLFLPVLVLLLLCTKIHVAVAATSLGHLIMLANLYLALYCVGLLTASVVIGAEPMAALRLLAQTNFEVLQIVQATGYIVFLLLQVTHLIWVLRHARKAEAMAHYALPKAVIQLMMATGVGLHYYVTVFERAMLDQTPQTGAAAYLLYCSVFTSMAALSQAGHKADDKQR